MKNNDNTWSCYKEDKKFDDKGICNNVKGKSKSDKWNSSYARCIIETDKDVSNTTVENICNKWSIPEYISDIKFTYHKSKNTYNKKGYCIPGKSRPIGFKTDSIISKDQCEKENNTYKRKYTFSNSEFCPTKAGKQVHIPDEYLNWTGGEITSDGKNNWKSDCSSTILSTCQVSCNAGYGGGGGYVCHYNNHSGEVCKKVNENHKGVKATSAKGTGAKGTGAKGTGAKGSDLSTICNRYINCMYDKTKQSCVSINNDKSNDKSNDIMKGQMEWLGPECYKLNNDAFAHGIYNYPSLDEVFPPLMRLFALAFIILLITGILYYTGSLGKITDKFVFGFIKKIITTIFKGLLEIIKDFVKGVWSLINRREFIGYPLPRPLSGALIILWDVVKIGIMVLLFIGGAKLTGNWSVSTGEYDKIDNEVIDDVSN